MAKTEQPPPETGNIPIGGTGEPASSPHDLSTCTAIANFHYQSELRQIQLDVQNRWVEVQSHFSDATQKSQFDAWISVSTAFNKYIQLYQKSQIDPTNTNLPEVYDAYREYVKVHRDAQAKVQKEYVEARQASEKDTAQIQEDAHRRRQEAFRNYLHALQQCLSNLDPQIVDAKTLAAAGHSMVAAATYASEARRG